MSETIHGICSLSVIPVRKDKSHESELVTELLFNEIYEIVDITKEWLKIRINDDGSEDCSTKVSPMKNIMYSNLQQST